MLLPTELLSVASIKDAEAGQLLLALDRERALIWIVEMDDARFAAFLTGEYAGPGFKITADSGGFGVLIGPLQIWVDPASASKEDGAWCLRARDGTLCVNFQSEERNTFAENRWAPVAAIESGPEAVFFSRWAVGVEADMEWEEVFSAADGKISSSLG